MTEMRRFEPRESCAIEPRAFGALFAPPQKPEPQIVDGIAVLCINGPLTHHLDPWFISYEEIVTQARAVMAHAPRAVVLRIDSPGGLVSGCFDAAREIRAVFGSVPIYAHVSGTACSAAYALACVADEVVISSTALVGSIGVIDVLVDTTAADAQAGLAFHVITSGARKADSHPHVPTEEAAIAARQAMVDDFARLFFELVAERRPLSVEQIEALEAGVFHGARAVAAGLADRVEAYPDFFARIGAGEQAAGAPAPAEGAAKMAAEDNDDVVEKLRKMAESDDEEKAARAKRALAALEDNDEEKDDEPASEKEEGEPEASAQATILSLSAKLAKLEASMAAKAEAEERQALLASRPDLPAETVAWLKTQPIAAVKGALAAIPKIPGRALGLAATAVVSGTQGASQADDSAPRLSPEAKAELDAKMGLLHTEAAVVTKGNKLILGARVPVTGKDA